MRTLLVVIALAMTVGCKNDAAVIHPDCMAFADHLETIAKGEIERLPEDKRDRAREHFVAANGNARTRAIEGCRAQGTGRDRNGTYRCMMAASTRAELEACP